jgi:hypothetical protein
LQRVTIPRTPMPDGCADVDLRNEPQIDLRLMRDSWLAAGEAPPTGLEPVTLRLTDVRARCFSSRLHTALVIDTADPGPTRQRSLTLVVVGRSSWTKPCVDHGHDDHEGRPGVARARPPRHRAPNQPTVTCSASAATSPRNPAGTRQRTSTCGQPVGSTSAAPAPTGTTALAIASSQSFGLTHSTTWHRTCPRV